MRRYRRLRAALACALALGGATAAEGEGPAAAAPLPAASGGAGGPGAFDVKTLFATTCGWCHSSGGREAGRGPKLMDTRLTDAEIIARIRNGKTGAMPSFASAFDEDQLQAIVHYIRALKPQGSPP